MHPAQATEKIGSKIFNGFEHCKKIINSTNKIQLKR